MEGKRRGKLGNECLGEAANRVDYPDLPPRVCREEWSDLDFELFHSIL